MADVTVIVPVWNGRELLERLLESLRAQTSPISEVLVLDNGSEDGSADAAERRGARAIRLGSNTGFSRAVNRGIQESRGAWIAIVNNDVELAPDWLERLLDAANRSDAWFATGKILRAAQPNLIDGTCDALGRAACALRIGHGCPDGPEFSTPRAVRLVSATAAVYRAELFRKAGLFDESFESYLEDVDFGLRCAYLGYAGQYVPEALAYHVGSATLGRWHPDSVRRMARNQVLLVAKHYPRRLLLRYSWSILVGQGLWGLVAVRHGAGAAWLQGKMAGLRMFCAARRAGSADPRRLASILEEGEREIRAVQRRTGFDPYWRWYFLLTTGEAK
jgi:GT2 family glycosyltransferase